MDLISESLKSEGRKCEGITVAGPQFLSGGGRGGGGGMISVPKCGGVVEENLFGYCSWKAQYNGKRGS